VIAGCSFLRHCSSRAFRRAESFALVGGHIGQLAADPDWLECQERPKETVFTVESGLAEEAPLSEHIKAVIARTRSSVVRQAQAEGHRVFLTVAVMFYADTAYARFLLDAAEMKQVTDLGLDLTVSVYPCADENGLAS